jgi:hypothetical protein
MKCFRALHNFAENKPVRAMNAVEVADTNDRRPEISGNVFEFVEDLHQGSDQISNSNFMPSYANRTPGGREPSVAACGRSWQI